MKSQKLKLEKRLKQVDKDIHQAEPEGNTRRLAVMFVTPSVSFAKTEHIARHIQWAIRQVRGFKHDALAWAFPKPGRYGKWTEYTHPGVVMLIKEVKK